MQISKLKKEINDELTTMESRCGDMDVKELSLVDRPDRLVINYKTASPIDPRKAALGDIKDKIRDAVRFFNEDFVPLTDAEIRDMCKDVFPQLEGQEALIRQMKEAAARIGLKWHDYDAGEDAWEDSHKGKWVKEEEPVIDLHGWNDAPNTSDSL